MYERVLRACRKRILAREYVVTLHAAEEMVADGYTVLDLERGILTGTILEMQRDRITGKLVIITVYSP